MKISNYFVLFLSVMGIGLSAQEINTLIHDTTKTFESIHWNTNGRILCVDYNLGRVYEIKTNGSVETLVSGLSNPAGGGFDRDGTYYFSELGTGKVFKLNSDNSTTLIASGLSAPTGIYPIPGSDILLVGQYNSNSVVKINKQSGAQTPWISGNGLHGPDAIIAYDNEFLIANFNNSKLFKADIDGNINEFINLGEPGFLGYLAYTGGYVYTPTYSSRKIYKIDENGVSTWIAGSGASGVADGETFTATFINPNGVCANPAGDTLLITDGSRIRIMTGFQSTVSTNEVPSSSIKISPNPVSDVLKIQLSQLEGDSLRWQILDITGKVVKFEQIERITSAIFEVNVSDLAKGSYFLILNINNKTEVKKDFIKF